MTSGGYMIRSLLLLAVANLEVNIDVSCQVAISYTSSLAPGLPETFPIYPPTQAFISPKRKQNVRSKSKTDRAPSDLDGWSLPAGAGRRTAW